MFCNMRLFQTTQNQLKFYEEILLLFLVRSMGSINIYTMDGCEYIACLVCYE